MVELTVVVFNMYMFVSYSIVVWCSWQCCPCQGFTVLDTLNSYDCVNGVLNVSVLTVEALAEVYSICLQYFLNISFYVTP